MANNAPTPIKHFKIMIAKSPFSEPLYVMLKPAGSLCNLACDYCYYLEKADLYKGECPVPKQVVSDELLERFTKQYIQSQTLPDVMFTWHGGEALMRPLSFYEKAIKFQKMYGKGYRVDNCLQTNGTMLTDDWCKFFKDNNFLIGISIDGPEFMHDKYRKNRAGKSSFAEVMRGVDLLNKHGVEWNAMAAINDYNSQFPYEFYNFFRSIDCRFIQFTPVVERIRPSSGRLAIIGDGEESPVAPYSVDPKVWGEFTCSIFDEWIKADVGKYFIQLFDSTLALWVGQQPGVCSMARRCGHAGVMEFNGDVYACDHFVFPEYKLGNIYETSLLDMMYSKKELDFGNDKHRTLTQQCKDCEYLFACNGECPRNRFATTASGEPGLNYLCQGYKRFFNHVSPYMDFMKRELMAKRPPANVMAWAKSRKL